MNPDLNTVVLILAPKSLFLLVEAVCLVLLICPHSVNGIMTIIVIFSTTSILSMLLIFLYVH